MGSFTPLTLDSSLSINFYKGCCCSTPYKQYWIIYLNGKKVKYTDCVNLRISGKIAYRTNVLFSYLFLQKSWKTDKDKKIKLKS